MADEQQSILEEFAAFLESKREADAQAVASDDEEVEIWDEKGRGARVRRSRARPFLQSLGIDLDTTGDGNSTDNKDDTKDDKSTNKGRTSTGKTASNSASSGIVRKYYAKKTT